MVTTHIQLRDARDRLLDLLGIGQTYPLRDLVVHDEQLTVTVNSTAKAIGMAHQIRGAWNVITRQSEKNPSMMLAIMTLLDAGTVDMPQACHASEPDREPSKLLISNLSLTGR